MRVLRFYILVILVTFLTAGWVYAADPYCIECHGTKDPVDYILDSPPLDLVRASPAIDLGYPSNITSYWLTLYPYLGDYEIQRGTKYHDPAMDPQQGHITHLTGNKGPYINYGAYGSGCITCHVKASLDSGDPIPALIPGACDTCHSPGGAFDGVAMATAADWQDGVYEPDGSTLQSGKEQWCAGCHDDVAAYSQQSAPPRAFQTDNPAAVFDPDGNWSTLIGHPDGYGDDLRYKAGGTGSDTATWTAEVSTDGTYNVYAWWITGGSRATNAPYTIDYDGGFETVSVNQKATSGQWNLLGTYPFVAGTDYSIVLSDGPDADGVVVADAIRLEPTSGLIITDNPDAVFDPDGNWSTLIGHPDGYGDDLRYKAGGTGSDTGTWTPDVSEAGDYNVYAWWITGGSRATNAPYTINYAGDSETVRVNQKATTGQWNLLGTYPFDAGTAGSVVLSDGPGSDGVVVGDAFKLEPVVGCWVIVDNLDATVDPDGNWSTYSGSAPTYGDDCRYKAEGTGTDTVTWTPDLTGAGNYYVYAWWLTGSSRATNAPYTINYDGGSETVRVNQKAGGTGGGWNLLGAYPFAAGTAGSVVLSDGPGSDGVVLADAIKLDTSEAGTFAPNVIGNNVSYGFYVTGHDDFACTACHDASEDHMDHRHRTYASASDNYQAAYRLKSVGGGEPMNIPRPSGNPIDNWQDFALCFDCHNRNEVLGEDQYDVSGTNFWDDDGSIRNSHYLHLGIGSTHFDSDFDGTADSVETCTACHNVHGSPTPAMVRHGELISTAGTIDKVPALNFGYVTSASDPDIDPNATLLDSIAGKMELAGGSIEATGVCNACHSAMTWYRDTSLDMIIDNPAAVFDPDGNWSTYSGSAPTYGDDCRYKAGGSGSDTGTWTPDVSEAGTYDVYAWWITGGSRATNAPYTINYDGGSETVRVNQKATTGQWNLLGTYPFAAGTAGFVVLSDGPGADGVVVGDAIKLE